MTWQAELGTLIEETMAHVRAMEGASIKSVVPLKIIERAIAETPRPARLESVAGSLRGAERDEITRRVASFRAVQERMQREREDYCDRTLSVARLTTRVKTTTTDK